MPGEFIHFFLHFTWCYRFINPEEVDYVGFFFMKHFKDEFLLFVLPQSEWLKESMNQKVQDLMVSILLFSRLHTLLLFPQASASPFPPLDLPSKDCTRSRNT